MYKYQDLYYVCWLIERFGRTLSMPRKEAANLIGHGRIQNYMRFADVFHCENPDKIIGELAEELGLEAGAQPKMEGPTLRQMAGVYARIINRVHENDYAQGVLAFFNSFLPPLLVDYKNELYWASMHYLSECYKEGQLL